MATPLSATSQHFLLKTSAPHEYDYAATIASDLHGFQMMFAIITPHSSAALSRERMKFSAFVAFMTVVDPVYCPLAHMVGVKAACSMGASRQSSGARFRRGTVVHISSARRIDLRRWCSENGADFRTKRCFAQRRA